jgi:WD40 repeat protein
MRSTRLVMLVLSVIPAMLFAQTEPERNRAEETEWVATPPQNLGSVINSPNDEPQVAITHSGLSLYFSSDRAGGYGNLDIWVSHRKSLDAAWGEPQNLGSVINSKLTEFAPSFSRDDHWMFFPAATSLHPGGVGGIDIYMSYRLDPTDDLGWQTPINLGPAVNSQFNEFDPVYFEDPRTGEATLYFISNQERVPNGHGGFLFDIYQSTRNADGSFQPAVKNKELSSPYDDRRVTIRKDGLMLIFTSDRPGSIGGLDLWVSTRSNTHDPWSEPVNLGPTINTEADERGAALAEDGVTLYFSSNRPGGFGGDDIWVTKLIGRDPQPRREQRRQIP